jgi:hypothetical protein
MSECPYCQKMQGLRQFRGYCSNVHYQLAKRKPRKIKLLCKGGCGTVITRNPSAIAPSGNAFCKNCGKNRGELHTKWKDGQYINSDGYRLVLRESEYVREHRWVWEKTNRSCLLPGAVIHHIDYDKLHNTSNNLVLFTSEEHGRFHRWIESGRYDQAATILRGAGIRQYYYPSGIDSFIVRLFTTSATYQRDAPASKQV